MVKIMIIFSFFFLKNENAIFCSDPGTFTYDFIYCGKTNPAMKILIAPNKSWHYLRQSPKCSLSEARVLYIYGHIGIAPLRLIKVKSELTAAVLVLSVYKLLVILIFCASIWLTCVFCVMCQVHQLVLGTVKEESVTCCSG